MFLIFGITIVITVLVLLNNVIMRSNFLAMKQLIFGLILIFGVSPAVNTFAQNFKENELSSQAFFSEDEGAFDVGEWFKFRIHYGLVTAGYATLEVGQDQENTNAYHIKGFGETVGLSRLFFKVEDYYESKVDKTTALPYQFIRKIDEGGHTKNKVVDFDQEARVAYVQDKKRNKEHTIKTPGDVQDMVSAFYYLRNAVDVANLKKGDEAEVTMFFDEENFPFKLRFLGREQINTKFGKLNALMFRPLVLAGRVFKEEESLTVWVSDDINKVPLRIKASLAVGSIKADLDEYKGLKHPFELVQD